MFFRNKIVRPKPAEKDSHTPDDMVVIRYILPCFRLGVRYNKVNYCDKDGTTYSTAAPETMELPGAGQPVAKSVLFAGYDEVLARISAKEKELHGRTDDLQMEQDR